MSNLSQHAKNLIEANLSGYVKFPIPHPTDNLVRLFAKSALASMDQLDSCIEAKNRERISSILGAFAERMAALAVRRASKRYVLEGLYALAIGSHRHPDIREYIMTLSLLYRSLEKLGVDPEPIFLEVAPKGEKDFARVVSTFPARSEANRVISSMGYREVNEASGFRYVYNSRWS